MIIITVVIVNPEPVAVGSRNLAPANRGGRVVENQVDPGSQLFRSIQLRRAKSSGNNVVVGHSVNCKPQGRCIFNPLNPERHRLP